MNRVGKFLSLFVLFVLKKLVDAQSATAIVPAYIYPIDSSTWQPLYSQITAHSNLFFTVIVNPNSGPGGSGPDVNYQREISKLQSYSNVRIVGYVSTNYTRRPIADVKKDVDSYANWPSAYRINGFFFDEAPVAADQAFLTYIKTIVEYSREKQGSGIKQTPNYIVTNPGAVPQSSDYLNVSPAPDLVVVVENTYANWQSSIDANRQAIWNLDADNNQLAVILHDVPDNLACQQITDLVNDFKGNVGVGSLWLTDLKGDASYTGWPKAPQFQKYINSFENAGKAC